MTRTHRMNRMNCIAVIAAGAAACAAFAFAPAFATVFPSGAASAQQTPAPCTYDTCALRIQAPTLTTPLLLVRGRDDIEVMRLGLLEPAVAPFVALSDSAVAHAHVYDVLYDRGAIINITGTVLAIGAPIVFQRTSQKVGFTVVGIGLTVYGGVLTNRANDALARAIWWYNRELPR
jgi:hypothetical protein